MQWGILIPIIGMILGPVMYLLYLKELQIKRGYKLADQGIAEQAARIAELEQRLRVLERIMTDGGVQTAAQIEALREGPASTEIMREKVQ